MLCIHFWIRFSTLRFVNMLALTGATGDEVRVPTPEALESAVRKQCAKTRTLLLQQ